MIMDYDTTAFLRKRQLIAEELRSTYRRRKAERIKRRYRPKPRHDTMTMWEKAAEICMQLNANAEDFVNAAFEQSELKEGPYPRMLHSVKASQWYKAYMAVRPKVRNPDIPKEKGIIEDVPEVGAADQATFEADVIMTMQKIARVSGQPMRGRDMTPEQLDVLKDAFVPIPFYIRVLMGYPCEEIMEKWGQEGIDFLIKRPNFKRQAELHEYPVGDILTWTKRR